MVVPGGDRGSARSRAIGRRSSRLDPANTSSRVGVVHSGAPRGEVSTTRSTDPGTPSHTTNASSFSSSPRSRLSSPASGAGQTQSGVAADAVAAPSSASGDAGGAPIERGAESTMALGGRESTFCGGTAGGFRGVRPETFPSLASSAKEGKCVSRRAPRNISNCVCRCASCVRFKNRLCAEMDRFERLDAAAYTCAPWPGPTFVGAVELPSRRWKMEV